MPASGHPTHADGWPARSAPRTAPSSARGRRAGASRSSGVGRHQRRPAGASSSVRKYAPRNSRLGVRRPRPPPLLERRPMRLADAAALLRRGDGDPAGVVERAHQPADVHQRRPLDRPGAHRLAGLALEVDDHDVAAGPQHLAEVEVAVDADARGRRASGPQRLERRQQRGPRRRPPQPPARASSSPKPVPGPAQRPLRLAQRSRGCSAGSSVATAARTARARSPAHRRPARVHLGRAPAEQPRPRRRRRRPRRVAAGSETRRSTSRVSTSWLHCHRSASLAMASWTTTTVVGSGSAAEVELERAGHAGHVLEAAAAQVQRQLRRRGWCRRPAGGSAWR